MNDLGPRKKLRIFLDLDEVLVDFVGGAARTWGVPIEKVEETWEKGVWDCIPPISRALGRKETMSKAEFWARINGNAEFWLNLPYLPWFNEVIGIVEKATDDFWLVSAPSRCVSSYSGKVRWIRAVFGERFDRFVLTPHKELLAKPGTVLIDDSPKNVYRFAYDPVREEKTGGEAILFPRRHNVNFRLVGSEVAFLEDSLSGILSARLG